MFLLVSRCSSFHSVWRFPFTVSLLLSPLLWLSFNGKKQDRQFLAFIYLPECPVGCKSRYLDYIMRSQNHRLYYRQDNTRVESNISGCFWEFTWQVS